MWPINNYMKKNKTTKTNQIKRQTNKAKTGMQINSPGFPNWKFPNFFRKGIVLTCWQIHSAKALPLHCWHWGYWIYDQSMFHSWRDLMNPAHLLHCYFFLPQQLQKKNGTLLKQVGIPNYVARSRCLQLVQVQFHKLCFSIFGLLKQEMLLGKLVWHSKDDFISVTRGNSYQHLLGQTWQESFRNKSFQDSCQDSRTKSYKDSCQDSCRKSYQDSWKDSRSKSYQDSCQDSRRKSYQDSCQDSRRKSC